MSTNRDLEMEMHDSLDNATLGVRRLRNENDRMRTALLAAAEQFALYADYHLAKEPPDRAKAETNVEWAARCRDAAKMPDTVA